MQESSEIVEFNDKGNVINLELTDEFKAALHVLQETNQSLFITGKAGCGKSTLLNYFVQNTDKRVAVLAFTGLAAINVGGETIHSFFKFPLGFIEHEKIKPKNFLKEKLNNVDVIVIDEVSMVRADFIDAIDKSLRVHRDNPKPFGGVQMIFIGDLYQLPPIVGKNIEDVYKNYYDSPYFFSAECWMYMRLPYINLEKIHRQKDQKFINILNSIRERKNIFDTLPQLNERVEPSKSKLVKMLRFGKTIHLTTTNSKSKEVNDYFLNKIEEPEFKYLAKITGEFDSKSFPTNEKLILKKGAKVMFIRNDNNEHKYVNGDTGIIVELDKEKIIVKINDELVYVEKETWENVRYSYTPGEDGERGSVTKTQIGSFIQYPLKLAWSITIHKSQGQTYENVYIDFHNGTFTSGQAYVALSRCRSLEGTTLKRPIDAGDVILDDRINRFYDMFENIIE